MGEQAVGRGLDERERQRFMRALLDDVHALEHMLETGRIESGVWRIGAEQEMFLVDPGMRPLPVADRLLQETSDRRLTGELALFNLEANLTPLLFEGRCLSSLRAELDEVLTEARRLAALHGGEVLLAGILPTLEVRDLGYDNMNPAPRYRELDAAIRAERGGDFDVHIRGLDELQLRHGNVMLEACNTSLQLHLQVGPGEASGMYNWAQALSAPLLAVAVNSPFLLGRRLWSETRVALFEGSVDSRARSQREKGAHPRVCFGELWLEGDPAELFKANISRYRPIIRGAAEDQAPQEVLRGGEVPRLAALALHSGTIYRWNRLCYGTAGGVAHLRIENRILPAGPSVEDEVANAAFFYGMMASLPATGAVADKLRFDQAKDNFLRVARNGLDAQLHWLDGRTHPAGRLVLEELLPAAREGLRARGVEAQDVERYLGVVEARVRSERTGARWAVDSWVALEGEGVSEPRVRARALAHGMLSGQRSERPVSEWSLARMEADAPAWRQSLETVGDVMTTDLFSARPDDLLDLAANLMDWHQVRHVPVEAEGGGLAGLISHQALLRAYTKPSWAAEGPVLVRDVMVQDPVTVRASTSTLEAMHTMRRHRISALPVVEGEQLVGLVTERDLIGVAARLLEHHLRPSR